MTGRGKQEQKQNRKSTDKEKPIQLAISGGGYVNGSSTFTNRRQDGINDAEAGLVHATVDELSHNQLSVSKRKEV